MTLKELLSELLKNFGKKTSSIDVPGHIAEKLKKLDNTFDQRNKIIDIYNDDNGNKLYHIYTPLKNNGLISQFYFDVNADDFEILREKLSFVDKFLKISEEYLNNFMVVGSHINLNSTEKPSKNAFFLGFDKFYRFSFFPSGKIININYANKVGSISYTYNNKELINIYKQEIPVYQLQQNDIIKYATYKGNKVLLPKNITEKKAYYYEIDVNGLGNLNFLLGNNLKSILYENEDLFSKHSYKKVVINDNKNNKKFILQIPKFTDGVVLLDGNTPNDVEFDFINNSIFNGLVINNTQFKDYEKNILKYLTDKGVDTEFIGKCINKGKNKFIFGDINRIKQYNFNIEIEINENFNRDILDKLDKNYKKIYNTFTPHMKFLEHPFPLELKSDGKKFENNKEVLYKKYKLVCDFIKNIVNDNEKMEYWSFKNPLLIKLTEKYDKTFGFLDIKTIGTKLIFDHSVDLSESQNYKLPLLTKFLMKNQDKYPSLISIDSTDVYIHFQYGVVNYFNGNLSNVIKSNPEIITGLKKYKIC